MADAEYRVVYKAVADFAALYAEVARAKAAVQSLKNDADKNTDVAASRRAAEQAKADAAQARADAAKANAETAQERSRAAADRTKVAREKEEERKRDKVEDARKKSAREQEAAAEKLISDARKAGAQTLANAKKTAREREKTEERAAAAELRDLKEQERRDDRRNREAAAAERARERAEDRQAAADKARLREQERQQDRVAADRRTAIRERERQQDRDRASGREQERIADRQRRFDEAVERRADIARRRVETDRRSSLRALEIEERQRQRLHEANLRRYQIERERNPLQTALRSAAADFAVARYETRRRQADERPGPVRELYERLGGTRREFSGAERTIRRRTENETTRLRSQFREDRGSVGSQLLSGAAASFIGLGDTLAKGLSGATDRLFSFRKLIQLAILSLGPLIAAVVQLSAGLVALGNSVIGAAGSLVYLPNLFAAAAQGAASLYAVFSPIVELFAAYDAVQKAQNKSSSQQVDAVKDQTRALEDLNDARKEALRSLQDLRQEVDRGSLNEQGAQLALRRAKADYRRTLGDPGASSLDREEAQYRVKTAEQDLIDVRTKNKRNVEDLTAAEKKGVEGSKGVVTAKDALATANKKAAGQTDALVTAQEELQRQLNLLGPNTRRFAEVVLKLKDAWKSAKSEIGEAFFGQITERQLTAIPKIFNNIMVTLRDTAGVLGGVFSAAFDKFAVRQGDFKKFADSNNVILKNLGAGATSFASALLSIAVLAGPSLERITKKIGDLFERFDKYASSADGQSGITKFFSIVETRLKELAIIFGNVFGTIKNLFFASDDYTKDFNGALADGTQKWEEWSEKQGEAGSAFQTFLENSKQPLKDIAQFLKDVVAYFYAIGQDPQNVQEMRDILKEIRDALPEIRVVLKELADSGLISTLIAGLGELAEAFGEFLKDGGKTPIIVIANALKILADAFSFIVSLPAIGPIFAGIATGLAVLAAASLIGKFSGLFALFRLMRGIQGLARAGGGGIGGFFRRALENSRDYVNGRDVGETNARRQGLPTPADLREQEKAGYRPELNKIIGLLEKLVTCCKNMGGPGGGQQDAPTSSPSGGAADAPDVDLPDNDDVQDESPGARRRRRGKRGRARAVRTSAQRREQDDAYDSYADNRAATRRREQDDVARRAAGERRDARNTPQAIADRQRLANERNFGGQAGDTGRPGARPGGGRTLFQDTLASDTQAARRTGVPAVSGTISAAQQRRNDATRAEAERVAAGGTPRQPYIRDSPVREGPRLSSDTDGRTPVAGSTPRGVTPGNRAPGAAPGVLPTRTPDPAVLGGLVDDGVNDIDETVSRVPGANQPNRGGFFSRLFNRTGNSRGSLGYNFHDPAEARGRTSDEVQRRRAEGLGPETAGERAEREVRQRTEYRAQLRADAVARREARQAARAGGGSPQSTSLFGRLRDRVSGRTPTLTTPAPLPVGENETDEQRRTRETTDRRAQQRHAAEQRRAQRQTRRRPRTRSRVRNAGGKAAGVLGLGLAAYELTNGFDFGGGDEGPGEQVGTDENGEPIYEQPEDGGGLASTAGLLALGFAPDLLMGGVNKFRGRTPRAPGAGGRLSNLFRGGGGATRAAGGAGRLGRLAGGAGKLLKGGGLLGIGGLLVGGAADAGAFGGKGSTGKQAGSAAGAALTGAGIGATIGSVIPGVGTVIGGAIGGLAGLGYSLFKDKGLRDKLGKAASSLGSTLASGFKSVGKTVVSAVTGVGKFLKGAFFDTPVQAAKQAGSFLLNGLKSIGGVLKDMFVDTPIQALKQAGSAALSAIKSVGGFLKDVFIDTPIQALKQAVSGIGGAISAGFGKITNFFTSIPRLAADILKKIPGVSKVASLFGFQSGGLVPGARDGTVDRFPAWVTPGEYVIRQKIVDKPRGKELLGDLNNDRLDPAAFYAGLNSTPTLPNVPMVNPSGIYAATNSTSNTVNRGGFNVGGVTIHNPIPEKSDQSLRRTLQNLAYLHDR